uniref:Uncharacterized protein n=1 Tax=Strigamia maritima TaxID=126957 RepID=T1J1A6_STRMM
MLLVVVPVCLSNFEIIRIFNMKGIVIFVFVAVIATVNSKLSNLLGGKTLKETILDCTERIRNQMFDIVEAGLKTDTEAHELLKEPFKEIKTNIQENMKAIQGFALNEAFWTIKNAAELSQDGWERHGKDILSGNFNHDHAYKTILQIFKNAEEFITVNNLAGDPTANKN